METSTMPDFDLLKLNIRIMEFPEAVKLMQDTPEDSVKTKSTYDFEWGENVGMPAKWTITFLNKRKKRSFYMKLGVFGVVVKLAETQVPHTQPIIAAFDMEIRKPDGSTYLTYCGEPMNMNVPGQFTGFKSVIPVDAIVDPSNGILVDNQHLNLHMIFRQFGSESQSLPTMEFMYVSTAGLCHDMLRLLESGENSDVEIVNPDGSLTRAHKFMLMARSPYFKERFKGSTETDEKWDLNEVQIASSTMQTVLRFIYGGVLDSSWKDNLPWNLVYAADLLKLEDLKALLDRKLIEACTNENLTYLLHAAHTYKLTVAEKQLKEKKMDCIVKAAKLTIPKK